ncbi:MAG: phenylalanine--tRNA ligase subunit alpha [Bacillota bacterium]|nr:phenylalanine--tRNA ligase subunit alpha [Bacillota bacterium]NLP22698.1 phenylalanine--tRNA ligase subunit alpha [Erysipelotrichaceae bacterium]
MVNIEKLREEAISSIESCETISDLSKLRISLLGKKGSIQGLMVQMKNLSNEEKPKFGQVVNSLKQEISNLIDEKNSLLQEKELLEKLEEEKIDITLPGYSYNLGTTHPLMMIKEEIEDLFIGLGYQIVEGPEVELDFYNFERANIPAGHPARDMQDTFYIDVETLLRTHTTAIQMRVLEKEANNLPIKVICPGKVYRRDDDDATHSHQFMQAEGLLVGENITLSDLKGTLDIMAKAMFGKTRNIRIRPSYFQFTEPSIEVDVSCHMCDGVGCPVCKGTGYIEILGAGMVHPNVLEMANIDSKKYTGFAFGVGIERIAMLRYGIDDIRNFYVNDVRFLNMFNKGE